MLVQLLCNLPSACQAAEECGPDVKYAALRQVRWYSFQFLMEELAEELEEMHAILSTLLSKLPTANLPSC